MYIANSSSTHHRIKSIYKRNSEIIYPPVDTERFTPSPRGDRLLVVCRLLPYKRVDAVVRAATKANIGLDIVGEGPAQRELQEIAGTSVRFHGTIPDDQVTELMQRARAVCVPGQEDFGIVPVEAQAAGKPVIAFAAGGALETVEHEVTGVLVGDHSSDTLLEAIRLCDQIETSPEEIAKHALRFSAEAFRNNLIDALRESAARPY